MHLDSRGAKLRTQIVIQQALLQLVDGGSGVVSDSLETYPDEHGTSDMVALNAGQPTLATFNPGGLLGFTVKLLNLPTEGTHLLSVFGRILSGIVGSDKVRALRRKHQPEQLHLMACREILDMHPPAVLFFSLRPGQPIHALVARLVGAGIHLTIVFERAVVDLVEMLDMQHQLTFGIPAIHQYASKRQAFVVQGIVQHLPDMIQFALAIPLRVVNPVVNDPELIRFRVDVDTRHHSNPLDNAMSISTVLPSHQFDLEGGIVIQHGVVKGDVSPRRGYHLSFHILPHHAGGQLFFLQIPFDRIMAKAWTVIGKIGQGIVRLAHQQKLTVVEAGYGTHAFSLSPPPFSCSFA